MKPPWRHEIKCRSHHAGRLKRMLHWHCSAHVYKAIKRALSLLSQNMSTSTCKLADPC